MVKIPIVLKLRKGSHKEIAKAQDIVIKILYETFEKAVFHGGTAIWRCYDGNRFSEDVDVYLPNNLEKIDLLFEKFEKAGFSIEKKKVGENSIYSNLKMNDTEVRFEALFKKVSGVLKDYETAEGNIIIVYTLAPEEFIDEKVNTYLKRLKIRDLYDIFFLLRHVKKKEDVKKVLKKLVDGFRKPEDESDLKVLILEGVIPGADKMLDYIKSFI
jgi:predicted nucleotidyltransferase component of viral defense system